MLSRSTWVLTFQANRGGGSLCPRRWSEVTRRLELWVQLRELNEAGEFTAVEVLPAKDVRTGGVFQLRQVRRCLCARLRKGSFWVIVAPLAGSVPPGPSGGAIGPGLGHHAPHRRLHPLRFHRRCQSSTDASIQKPIATGEVAQNETCWTDVLFFCQIVGFSSVSVLKRLSPFKLSD